MNNSYLDSAIKQFKYYKSLGDKTFELLNFDEMQWQSDENCNSIAIIVKHVAGNMLSRWTNFLSEDGEKEWRHRDDEFINTFHSKEDIIATWESGWFCFFNAINSLKEEHLNTIVYIRNQEHTVTEAINRQLSHYPYHVGQIVFLGKLIKGNQWNCLSIPKGKSSEYNIDKFSKEKNNHHLTANN